MAYEVDGEGRVRLGGRLVEPPPTISAEARAFLATSPYPEAAPAAGEPVPMWTLREHVDGQMRALGEAALARYPVKVEEISIAGVRCHLVQPEAIRPENAGKALMNLHAGSFVLGSGSLVEAAPIAALAGVPVVAVDYRLAPEHPFPAAVDDATAVYRSMLERHAPGALGVYGSSAGGFLTGQVISRLRREGLPLPACCGVFTAGGDLLDFGDTAQIFTLMGFWGELILPLDHPVSEVRAYLGAADPADVGVSPALGDLSGFPPTLLMAGTRDALLSATANFHRALRRASVEAELYVFDAMPHAHWYMLNLPEAQEAVQTMAGFFLKHLNASRDPRR